MCKLMITAKVLITVMDVFPQECPGKIGDYGWFYETLMSQIMITVVERFYYRIQLYVHVLCMEVLRKARHKTDI